MERTPFDPGYARAVADDQDHRKVGEEARRIERLRQVAGDARNSDEARLAALTELQAAVLERERIRYV